MTLLNSKEQRLAVTMTSSHMCLGSATQESRFYHWLVTAAGWSRNVAALYRHVGIINKILAAADCLLHLHPAT